MDKLLLNNSQYVARLLVVATCSLFVPAEVVSSPPTLEYLFPAGGQRGTKVVATCRGAFDWPVNVWAPGVEVVAGGEKGKLEIYVPHYLAADRVWIRLYNKEGISAPAPFLIGNLPELNGVLGFRQQASAVIAEESAV